RAAAARRLHHRARPLRPAAKPAHRRRDAQLPSIFAAGTRASHEGARRARAGPDRPRVGPAGPAGAGPHRRRPPAPGLPPRPPPPAEEMHNCRPCLRRELELLPKVRVVLALGRIGFESVWRAMQELGRIGAGVQRPAFAHGARFAWDPAQPTLLMSYHPSRQNTQTGRLTREMFHSVFAAARELVAAAEPGAGAAERFH